MCPRNFATTRSCWFGAYVALMLTTMVTMMVLFTIFRAPNNGRTSPACRETNTQKRSEQLRHFRNRQWTGDEGADEYIVNSENTKTTASSHRLSGANLLWHGGENLREFQGTLQEKADGLRHLLTGSGRFNLPSVGTVNCSLLWTGDQEELPRARLVANETKCRRKGVHDYLQDTMNCTRYVLDGGFRVATVSEDELSFPLAFSLLVYRDIEQAERLLRAIYRPHNIYCVHVDQKSDDDVHTRMRLIISCLPNVFLVERSINVTWGEFSVLEPEIECMRRMWAHPTRWRYFINLTGQEFPLKTNKELVQILKAFHGANDISGTVDPQFEFRWSQFLPAPYNLTISKGYVYIVASRGYVDYVLHSRVARDFLGWVRPSRNPDETFFSTLNHNPQLGVPGSFLGDIQKTYKESFSRYTVWMFKDTDLCEGKWVRTVCHFGVGDLTRLTRSPQLFANKFSYDFMPLAYDCLEAWYFEKVAAENKGTASQLNVSLYENSALVKQQYKGPVLTWD